MINYQLSHPSELSESWERREVDDGCEADLKQGGLFLFPFSVLKQEVKLPPPRWSVERPVEWSADKQAPYPGTVPPQMHEIVGTAQSYLQKTRIHVYIKTSMYK